MLDWRHNFEAALEEAADRIEYMAYLADPHEEDHIPRGSFDDPTDDSEQLVRGTHLSQAQEREQEDLTNLCCQA